MHYRADNPTVNERLEHETVHEIEDDAEQKERVFEVAKVHGFSADSGGVAL